MAKYEIAVEYKSGHLTSPLLHQIIGAAIRARPDLDEIIVRCLTAARTAYDAASDYNKRAATLKNREGRNVRVTLAVGPLEG
jgi:hypothetical protein